MLEHERRGGSAGPDDRSDVEAVVVAAFQYQSVDVAVLELADEVAAGAEDLLDRIFARFCVGK